MTRYKTLPSDIVEPLSKILGTGPSGESENYAVNELAAYIADFIGSGGVTPVIQNNLIPVFRPSSITSGYEEVSEAFNNSPQRIVDADEILNVINTYQKQVGSSIQVITDYYLLRIGKGVYGVGGDTLTTENDFLLYKPDAPTILIGDGNAPTVEIIVASDNTEDEFAIVNEEDQLFEIVDGTDTFFIIKQKDSPDNTLDRTFRFIGAAGSYGNGPDNTLPSDFVEIIGNTNVPTPIESNRIIEGVIFREQGLTFSSTFFNFFLNGLEYNENSQTVTVDDGDTLDRFDVFVFNTDGVLSVIKGIPDANPLKPDIDISTQIEVGFIRVTANSTEQTPPDNLIDKIVYNENLGLPNEFQILNSSLDTNTDSEENPLSGIKNITISTSEDITPILFVDDEVNSVSELNAFLFSLFLPANVLRGIAIQFFNDTTNVSDALTITGPGFGYDPTNLNTYQNIVIPKNALNFFPGATSFSRIRMTFYNILSPEPITFNVDRVLLKFGTDNTQVNLPPNAANIKIDGNSQYHPQFQGDTTVAAWLLGNDANWGWLLQQLGIEGEVGALYETIDGSGTNLLNSQVGQETGKLYLVKNASSDPAISTGFGLYKYSGTTNGTLADYVLQILNLGSSSANKYIGNLDTTGELDVSSENVRVYNDYDSGPITLSLSTNRVLGGICTVRIKGSSPITIPPDWSFAGDIFSASSLKFNEIYLLYISDTDIRVTNRVIGINDPSVVEDISLEHLWFRFDPTTSTTNSVNGLDLISSVQDSLETSPFTASTVENRPRLVSELGLDAAFFDPITNAGGGQKLDIENMDDTIFKDSFSVFMQLKLEDGNSSAIQYVLEMRNGNVSRFWFDIRTDGKLTVAYTSNSVNVFAQTENPVFSNGPDTEFKNVALLIESGVAISILVNGVIEPLASSFNGDMSGVDMSLFNSAGATFRIGKSFQTDSNGYYGYLRNLIMQDVIYTAQNITDLSSI